MEILYVIIGLAIVGALVYLISELQKLKTPQDDQSQKLMLDVMEKLRVSVQDGDDKTRKSMQDQLDKMTKQLAEHQRGSLDTLQKQFGQSAKIIEDVTKKLTKLDETNKQVVGFAEQMKSLENILKNPKQRGILGEYFLESMLTNVLPPNQFQMQYRFKNGDAVDAAIFIGDKIIPIDAKFSLENYNKLMQEGAKDKREVLEKEFKKDLKNRIDETSKYIRQGENTLDFAFMYIPAEGVYYNLLVNEVGAVEVNSKDLIEYAFSKHVLIVSPTTLLAQLQTVLHGLNALKMEKSVQEIVKNVDALARHLNSYHTFMDKLGNNLGTTVNMYNQASHEFKKIDKDVYKITDGKAEIGTDLPLLEKPGVDD